MLLLSFQGFGSNPVESICRSHKSGRQLGRHSPLKHLVFVPGTMSASIWCHSIHLILSSPKIPSQGSSVFPPVNAASKCLVVKNLLLIPFSVGFYIHRHFMEDKSQRTAQGPSYLQKCVTAILFHSVADLVSQVTERHCNLGTKPSKGRPSN